jgi:hypothetical protein
MPYSWHGGSLFLSQGSIDWRTIKGKGSMNQVVYILEMVDLMSTALQLIPKYSLELKYV